MSETPESRAVALAIRYANNRSQIADLTHSINEFSAFGRVGGGVYLDSIREEYLEDGDRWRGWKHAIEYVQGNRDPDDDDATAAEQRDLADLLDRKAALRVEAGLIKRSIAALGRSLIRSTS
ncbi:hypothetical protein ACYZT4_10835 [Pseudomonas sp. GB2N2]